MDSKKKRSRSEIGASPSWADDGDVESKRSKLTKKDCLLEKLPPGVRAVYEFAQSKPKLFFQDLQPDPQHCAFIKHVLDNRKNAIFLTGIPGSGKSTVLNLVTIFLIHQIANALTDDALDGVKKMGGYTPSKKLKPTEAARMMVVASAPTGAAAKSLYHAITFDSLFSGCDLLNGHFEQRERLPPGVFARLAPIRVLVIDELSMIHPTKFANADRIFRLVKNQKSKLFGGIKLICSGDFFQLKPVYDKHDDVTKAMGNLSKDAAAKKHHPLVFDTIAWQSHEQDFTFVMLDKSFRQDRSQLEFMDLLLHVRDASLELVHEKLIESRVMDYETFCATTDLEVTPIFKNRDAVDHFNVQKLADIPGTEYSYMTSMICSTRAFRDVAAKFDLHDDDQYAKVFDNLFSTPSSTKPRTRTIGDILNNGFECRANPVSEHSLDGINWLDIPATSFSGYYFDPGVLPSPEILNIAQRQHGVLGRANFLTRLKVGAKVSITQNLSIADDISNGTLGTIVCFMSVQCFMSAKGTKKAGSVYISKKQDPRDTATDMDPIEDYDFIKWFGLVDPETRQSKNAKRELFPLVELDKSCKTRFVLITPIITQLHVSTQARHKQDAKQIKTYMSRTLANHTTPTSHKQTMTEMSPAEHLALLAQAKRSIALDNGTPTRGTKIFALHMPVTLAWATTVHSVQGLTIDALWLGDCGNFMEDGMFYVVLSRVAGLDRIAWSVNPIQYIKSNERVKDFYARLLAIEATK